MERAKHTWTIAWILTSKLGQAISYQKTIESYIKMTRKLIWRIIRTKKWRECVREREMERERWGEKWKENRKQTQDARDELYATIMRMGNTSTQAAAKKCCASQQCAAFQTLPNPIWARQTRRIRRGILVTRPSKLSVHSTNLIGIKCAHTHTHMEQRLN